MKLTREQRRAVVARLEAERAAGTLTAQRWRELCAGWDITVRYGRALLAGGAPADPAPRGRRLSQRMIELYYDTHGNAARVWRALETEGGAGVTERQLRRMFDAQLDAAERAFVRDGSRARRALTAAHRWEAGYRNAVWQIDFTEPQVCVRLPRGRRGQRVRIVHVIDCSSRVLTGYMIAPTDSSDAVFEALHDAFSCDEENPFGGIPELLVYDNGKAFLAEAVQEAAVELGFDTHAIDAYTPRHNGKVERVHQTLAAETIAEMPGFRDGPRDERDRLYDEPAAMVEFDTLVAETRAGIARYNTELTHSALGCTPAHAYRQDPTPIRVEPPERLAFALRNKKRQTVQPSGVYKHGRYYTAPELGPLIGSQVIVAWLRKDTRFVWVYRTDGTPICQAFPHHRTTPEQRAEAKRHERARHAEQNRRMRASRRRARERFAPTNVPGGYVDLTDPAPATAAKRDQIPELARAFDEDPALNLPWRAPRRPARPPT